MASLIVDRGCSRIVSQAFQATSGTVVYSATRYVQVMSVDDSTVAFAAGHTALNSGGAVTNEYDAVFDSGTVISGTKTVAWSMTVPTGSGNFTIRRIAEHDDNATNTTTSSTTLCMGVDNQALQKTSDFSLRFDKVLTQNSA